MNRLDEKTEELRTQITDGLDDDTKALLSDIDLTVTTGYTLADAIREGSAVTDQAVGWGDGDTACALTAAHIAAKARKYMN